MDKLTFIGCIESSIQQLINQHEFRLTMLKLIQNIALSLLITKHIIQFLEAVITNVCIDYRK